VAAIPAERATWDAERTNAEIGTELDISPKIAGVHVSNIARKLGVWNLNSCSPRSWAFVRFAALGLTGILETEPSPLTRKES